MCVCDVSVYVYLKACKLGDCVFRMMGVEFMAFSLMKWTLRSQKRKLSENRKMHSVYYREVSKQVGKSLYLFVLEIMRGQPINGFDIN